MDSSQWSYAAFGDADWYVLGSFVSTFQGTLITWDCNKPCSCSQERPYKLHTIETKLIAWISKGLPSTTRLQHTIVQATGSMSLTLPATTEFRSNHHWVVWTTEFWRVWTTEVIAWLLCLYNITTVLQGRLYPETAEWFVRTWRFLISTGWALCWDLSFMWLKLSNKNMSSLDHKYVWH